MNAKSVASDTDNTHLTDITFSPAKILRESTSIDDEQNNARQQTEVIKFRYTIQKGDFRRLDRDGVLKVYKINEPVNIPVRRLLGKWKDTHIGVTIFKLNEEWKVEGEEQVVHSKEALIAVAKRWLSKHKAYIYPKNLSIGG